MYVPFFFVFFLSNSLRVNGGMRFQEETGRKSMLVAVLANSVGLLLIVVVPMMFVLPCFNRYFFRMTGRIYLGPMVTCLVFIMILITNAVIYIPL
jgi:hypothetical protein